MFFTTQRSIYGNKLQLAQTLGVTYKPLVNTTLNEKFNVAVNEPIVDGSKHTLKYVAIGNGGNAILPEASNYPYSPHSPIDACLFNHIPFIIRPKDEDLYDEDRKQYRMRKIMNFKGTEYVCYYLRVMKESDFTYNDTFEQISKRGDIQTIDLINIEEKNPLNPTPISKVNKVISSNAAYIVNTAKMIFKLTKQEIEEINKAIDIIYDGHTEGKKAIREIAFCHGVDKVLDNGIEAIEVQVNLFVGPNIDLLMELAKNEEVYRTYELGGMEPLYIQ